MTPALVADAATVRDGSLHEFRATRYPIISFVTCGIRQKEGADSCATFDMRRVYLLNRLVCADGELDGLQRRQGGFQRCAAKRVGVLAFP
jgi:hypothetical protein